MNATIPVRMPDEMLAALDSVAEKQHNSRAGIVRLAIDLFLQSVNKADDGEAVEETKEQHSTEA